MRQIDPAEFSPGEFSHLLRKCVEQEDTDVVVIDSLTGYLHSMPGENFLTTQMHEILTYLNQHGIVTMLVLAQYGIMGTQMASPVDVSYLADTVLLLRHFEAAGTIRKAISVVKRRIGPHETTIRELSMSHKGIIIGHPLTEFHGVLTGIPTYTGRAAGLAKGGDDGD
jgi:circadian clock protein KaiC